MIPKFRCIFKMGTGTGGRVMDKEVVAVSKEADKYFVVLEDETRIRVDSKEYKKVKKKLSRNIVLFLKVNEESDCIE